MPQVKIEGTAKELKPLRNNPNGPLYTGLKIKGAWYNLEGDHRNLYNKAVDLNFTQGSNIVTFATPQTPPAQHQQPPKVPPPPSTNGHTPHWPDRESAAEAYIFYVTKVAPYLTDPIAAARAANCLVMMEAQGDINPVHRPGETAPF